MSDEWLSGTAAAARLGVSPARLEQMVGERKIAPVLLPDGETAYPSGELARFQRPWHRGMIGSPAAGLLEPAAVPLTRTRDVVVSVSRWSTSYPVRVHVRIWEGPAPEGRRTVIAVAAVGDAIIPRFEMCAEALEDEILDCDATDAVWFHVPQAGGHDRIENVLVARNSMPLLRRLRSSGRFREPLRVPIRRAASMNELERVVGAPVEVYPRRGYTEQAIEQWQLTGRMGEVAYDSSGIAPLSAALGYFAGVAGSASPRAKVAKATARKLANAVEERHQARALLDEAELFDEDLGASPAAVKVVDFELPADEWELVRKYGDGGSRDPWPWDSDTIRRHDGLLVDLLGWREQVDEHSDAPDTRAAAALRTAIDVLKRSSQAAHYAAGLPGEVVTASEPVARTFAVAGPADRSYLKSITWERPGTKRTREHRLLLAEIDEPDAVEFGCDGFGHLVAVLKGYDRGDQELMHVLWPRTGLMLGLPADATIASDQTIGDRPVYLRYSDGRMDLLPLLGKATDQWNFGYGGGGPGMLSAAIGKAIESSYGVDVAKAARPRIELAVERGGDQQLRVKVGDLLG